MMGKPMRSALREANSFHRSFDCPAEEIATPVVETIEERAERLQKARVSLIPT